VKKKHSLPPASDATKHPYTNLGLENKSGFLIWIKARSSSGIIVEQKGIPFRPVALTGARV